MGSAFGHCLNGHGSDEIDRLAEVRLEEQVGGAVLLAGGGTASVTDTTFAACEMSCFDRNCAPRMRRVTGLHTSVVVTGVVVSMKSGR